MSNKANAEHLLKSSQLLVEKQRIIKRQAAMRHATSYDMDFRTSQRNKFHTPAMRQAAMRYATSYE